VIAFTRENDRENRKLLSSRQNETIDEAARTRSGSWFKAWAAAALSPCCT